MYPKPAAISEYPERYSINGKGLMKEKVEKLWLTTTLSPEPEAESFSRNREENHIFAQDIPPRAIANFLVLERYHGIRVSPGGFAGYFSATDWIACPGTPKLELFSLTAMKNRPQDIISKWTWNFSSLGINPAARYGASNIQQLMMPCESGP
jgi:hypothetical protein